MVGLPRSGKSTQAKVIRLTEFATIVNPDSVRLAIHGHDFILDAEGFVWATVHAMVRSLFLAGNETLILDATNVTRKRRDVWKSKTWKTVYCYIDTPKEICFQRCDPNNKGLLQAIEKMAQEFEPLQSDEPLYEC